MAAGRDVGPAFASLRVNAAGFRSLDRADDWQTATGLALAIQAGGHEITGELTYRVPTAGGRAAQREPLTGVALPEQPLLPRNQGNQSEA
ncbi:MAG: hypothetical protein ACREQL_03145 [Candidatus Binatia bacterium]